MFLDKAIEEYLWTIKNGLSRSENTVLVYRDSLNIFLRYMGNVEVSKITTENIIYYCEYLKNYNGRQGKYSDATIQTRIVAVKSFLRWIKLSKGLDTANCQFIKTPDAPRRITCLDDDDIATIRREINTNTFRGIRMRCCFEIMLSSGCRVGELLNIKIQDIKPNGEIVVFGKGRKYRIVFLSKRALVWTNKYLKQRNDDCPYLVVTRRCEEFKPLSYRAFSEQVIRLRKRSGVAKPWSSHTLRHTNATHAIINGASLYYVQQFLGHKSTASTEIYLHVTNPELKKAHKRYVRL